LSRLKEFYGIGKKKASMTLNSLVRDFGHEIKDKSIIDVAFDRHIKKIFLRTGLVDKIDEDKIINKAKEANPDFSGKLDLPCWIIGREWCDPSNPRCNSCVLTDCCKKAKLEITDFE
jgi:endonuclease III